MCSISVQSQDSLPQAELFYNPIYIYRNEMVIYPSVAKEIVDNRKSGLHLHLIFPVYKKISITSGLFFEYRYEKIDFGDTNIFQYPNYYESRDIVLNIPFYINYCLFCKDKTSINASFGLDIAFTEISYYIRKDDIMLPDNHYHGYGSSSGKFRTINASITLKNNTFKNLGFFVRPFISNYSMKKTFIYGLGFGISLK